MDCWEMWLHVQWPEDGFVQTETCSQDHFIERQIHNRMAPIKKKRILKTVSRTYCECSGMPSFRWTHSGKMIIRRTTVSGTKCLL